MLLVHRRHVIEPIEIADRLQIGLVFDQFLGAAVKQANMRIDALYDLAIKFQDKAQNPVSRGVLRPKIYREIALSGLGHCPVHRAMIGDCGKSVRCALTIEETPELP